MAKAKAKKAKAKTKKAKAKTKVKTKVKTKKRRQSQQHHSKRFYLTSIGKGGRKAWIESDSKGGGFYVFVDGLCIAQRGWPNTPQAGTWVSLEPGWEVVGGGKVSETITIRHKGAVLQ